MADSESAKNDFVCSKEGHDFSIRDREVSALDGFIQSKPLCSLREKGGPTLNLCIRCGRFIQVPDEPAK